MRASRGTSPYSFSQEDVDTLGPLRPNFGPYVSQVQGTKEEVDHSFSDQKLPSAEIEAIGRLHNVHDWKSDIMIMAFREFDTAFICGKL